MSQFNFNGWNLKDWFVGNASTIKELIKVGVPFGLTLLATHAPAWVAIGTVLGKLILDSADYYISA